MRKLRSRNRLGNIFASKGQLFEYVLNNSSYQNDNSSRELANLSTREDCYSRKTSEFIVKYNNLQPKDSFGKLEVHLIDKLVEWRDNGLLM